MICGPRGVGNLARSSGARGFAVDNRFASSEVSGVRRVIMTVLASVGFEVDAG